MKWLVTLLLLCSIGFAQETKKYDLNREKQLIAGVVILQHSDKYLTGVETKIYMSELLKITKYSPKDAKRIIQKFTGKPERFKRVLEDIEEELKGKKDGK